MVPIANRALNWEQQWFLCLTVNLVLIKLCGIMVMLGKKNKGCWVWKHARCWPPAFLRKPIHRNPRFSVKKSECSFSPCHSKKCPLAWSFLQQSSPGWLVPLHAHWSRQRHRQYGGNQYQWQSSPTPNRNLWESNGRTKRINIVSASCSPLLQCYRVPEICTRFTLEFVQSNHPVPPQTPVFLNKNALCTFLQKCCKCGITLEKGAKQKILWVWERESIRVLRK